MNGSNGSVGFMVLKQRWLDEQSQEITVDMAVWYPSATQPSTFKYVQGTNRISTKVAVNGKAASGRYPLIIYSHGGTGSAMSSAFITETLARKGYVVAGVDYTDPYTMARISGPVSQRRLRKLRMLKWLNDVKTVQLRRKAKEYRKRLAYRPQQLRLTIDRLLAENKDSESLFRGLINEGQIGIVGHSFGAWTAMMVSGVDPAYHDSRVKASVMLSGPANESVYSVNKPNEVENIRIPIMFMYGQKETELGKFSRGDDKKWLYDRANAPKFLLSIDKADHFTFSGGVRKEFPTMNDYLRRDIRRKVITEYVLAFLDYYIKNASEARNRLNVQSGIVKFYHKDFGQ